MTQGSLKDLLIEHHKSLEIGELLAMYIINLYNF